MITLFTVPKPFTGRAAVIQNQAIASWEDLLCVGQILMLDQQARTNGFGTPLLDSVFAIAAAKAKYDTLLYTNADIIFMGGVEEAVQSAMVKHHEYMIVGRRTDIPFTDVNLGGQWKDALWRVNARAGTLHPAHGIDYFIFRRETVDKLAMPSFAVGRPAWDNWLIARCLALGLPVIDATGVIRALHPKHGYEHLKGGLNEMRHGAEAAQNRHLAGDVLNTINDATSMLIKDVE